MTVSLLSHLCAMTQTQPNGLWVSIWHFSATCLAINPAPQTPITGQGRTKNGGISKSAKWPFVRYSKPLSLASHMDFLRHCKEIDHRPLLIYFSHFIREKHLFPKPSGRFFVNIALASPGLPLTARKSGRMSEYLAFCSLKWEVGSASKKSREWLLVVPPTRVHDLEHIF